MLNDANSVNTKANSAHIFQHEDMPPAELTGPLASYQPTYDGPNSSEIENDGQLIPPEGLLFDNETIRRGFIRKVYSILMCQLLVTALIITLFICHKPTQRYFDNHFEYFLGSLLLTIILVIFMACCTNIRRKAPMNYICLFLFTLCEGFLLGTFSASLHSPHTVLIAAGLTTIVCLSLTIFAFQTKWDFTRMSGTLFIALILLTIFGITAITFRDEVMVLLHATIGVFLFSIYLIHDTQLMVGGKHKYSISPEEYIFGALNLYLDIVRIFLHLLMLSK